MLKRISFMTLMAVTLLASCKTEPTIVITDKGPDVTVLSHTELAYMGTEISFSVNISDKNYALSNIKVELCYAEEVVASTMIRTSEAGDYEGRLIAPVNKNGQEGIAELVFIGQNVAQGTTKVIREVEIKKPDFAQFYAVLGTNDKRLMVNDGNCHYSLTDNFPAEFSVSFESAEIASLGKPMVYGFQNGVLTCGSTGKTVVKQSFEGECTLEVDLLRMAFSHRSSSVVTFTEDQPEVVLSLVQDSVLDFAGVDGFTMDIDFFDQQNGKCKFRAISGTYKLFADFAHSFIRVDPVNADGSYISAYDQTEGIKAIYVIGSGISKGGVPSAAWNIDTGAWPLAQYEKDKYCISFLAGRDVILGSYFHLYNCRGWTSTFGHEAFSSINIAPAFKMDMSDTPSASGNIGTDNIELGKGYRLLFDFTEGYNQGKVSVEEVEFPIVGDVITVCGKRASVIDKNHYYIASLSISKGNPFTVEGAGDVSALWIDPDYVTDGKFSAMTGYYQVDVYTDKSYVEFHRLKSDGGTFADINTGAIWLMGWGVGTPSLAIESGDNQPGWNPAKAVPMAEIVSGVYQFSGIAAEETDMKVGHRIRYDYLGLVWYGENGWNQGNKGVMKGMTNEIRYTDRAREYLADVPGNGWQVLSKTLEKDEFYVLTIDLNTPNVELVDFYKKGN